MNTLPVFRRLAIALAAWRIDGLASLRAKEEPGVIETHDFVPKGKHLVVNADLAATA